MPYQYEISCIIINYNSLDALKSCIVSLLAQRGVNHEVVIIDNGSTDNPELYFAELRQKFDNIQFILNKANWGYGKAANVGARIAKGEYLIILNPDTKMESGALKYLYQYIRNNRTIGLLSPLLISPDGTMQLSARELPTRSSFFSSRGSILHKLGISRESDAGYLKPLAGTPLKAEAVSATALVVSAEIFSKVNGFDERYFMYMEDIDLCRRISKLGYEVVLNPEIKVEHAWRKSSSQRPYFTLYHQHLSIYKYFCKFEPERWFLNMAFSAVLGCSLVTNSILVFFWRLFK